jgi:diguanylate cyclase (GGDEF)-like protein
MGLVRRSTLLVRFGVLSALAFLVIGGAVTVNLQSSIRQRAVKQAKANAVVLSKVALEPLVTRTELQHGLSSARLDQIDHELNVGELASEVTRLKIWNDRSVIVYSDDRAAVGRHFAGEDEVIEALRGETSGAVVNGNDAQAEHISERGQGELLETYVPIGGEHGARPAGVLEVYLPFSATAKAIDGDVHRLVALLALGLTLLYLALFRSGAGASRRLREQAETNRQLARQDQLTGLPNRARFDEALTEALDDRRDGEYVGVIIIDLDRFKEVNDTLGHTTGDELLRRAHPRLAEVLDRSDTLARLGGDEFGVVLPGRRSIHEIEHLADRLVDALELPIDLEQVSLRIEGSVGVAVGPDHGTDAETLLRRADVAMYAAKESHGGTEVYKPGLDTNSADHLTMAAELRRGIAAGELVVHYQPQADLRTGTITAVEALVRWQHPRHGLLAPDEFIPLAERTGLISGLTRVVLGEALRQVRVWKDQGRALRVAVNLSPRVLHELSFPRDVVSLLDETGASADDLELEITESTIATDPERAVQVVSELAGLGIRLAIDDFGTGYSSLSKLRELPVRSIKIDKSFVMAMDAREDDAVIVRSTVDLGRNLGLEVVAEGIEDERVWHRLRELGCAMGQGYLLSRPIPADELTRWLDQREVATSREAADPGSATRTRTH